MNINKNWRCGKLIMKHKIDDLKEITRQDLQVAKDLRFDLWYALIFVFAVVAIVINVDVELNIKLLGMIFGLPILCLLPLDIYQVHKDIKRLKSNLDAFKFVTEKENEK